MTNICTVMADQLHIVLHIETYDLSPGGLWSKDTEMVHFSVYFFITPRLFCEVNLYVTLIHYPKYDIPPSNSLQYIKQNRWTMKYRSPTYIYINHQPTYTLMKAVFSEETYVPPTIYLSLELICEMRWDTPKHCNLLVCLNVCCW